MEAREPLARRWKPPTASERGRSPNAAETELRASGGRPRRTVLTGLDSLTASERRIGELAGQGLSNREIAQTLFVTNRTVEGHLTNVYRKLRVDSRTKLQAALAGQVAVSM
jgi:DNA-binding NarL/FixJ family response regulator